MTAFVYKHVCAGDKGRAGAESLPECRATSGTLCLDVSNRVSASHSFPHLLLPQPPRNPHLHQNPGVILDSPYASATTLPDSRTRWVHPLPASPAHPAQPRPRRPTHDNHSVNICKQNDKSGRTAAPGRPNQQTASAAATWNSRIIRTKNSSSGAPGNKGEKKKKPTV